MGELILLRHGETEWSLDGKHTGRTDIPLTARGEAAAKALEPVLSRHGVVAVFTSPARRPGPGRLKSSGYGEGGTFQDVMTGSACSVPRALTVPVSSRNSRPPGGGSRR